MTDQQNRSSVGIVRRIRDRLPPPAYRWERKHLAKLAGRFAPRNLADAVESAAGKRIRLYWSESPNWGDALSPVLVEWLSGRRPVHPDRAFSLDGSTVYSAIGSVLHRVYYGPFEVWGSGLLSNQDMVWRKPARVHAVRGPMTRRRLLDLGIDCPKVFGDPALLFPRMYSPPPPPVDSDLGIIVHYAEADHPLARHLQECTGARLIDICGGLTKVADEVRRCRMIASSSLHGIILADAFHIPSTWIRLTDKVVGAEFKFHDYFKSVGRLPEEPLRITQEVTAQQILDRHAEYELDIDLDALFSACPFRTEAGVSHCPEHTGPTFRPRLEAEVRVGGVQ